METVQLLSPAKNFAVVKLPGRQFPGVVFQGDSLHAKFKEVQTLKQLLSNGAVDELAEGIGALHEEFQELVSWYEEICALHGIGLPYTPLSDTSQRDTPEQS